MAGRVGGGCVEAAELRRWAVEAEIPGRRPRRAGRDELAGVWPTPGRHLADGPIAPGEHLAGIESPSLKFYLLDLVATGAGYGPEKEIPA
ncbi:hypothetical protein [Phytoactinopolyspora limicola]|uniref:hypothetical protein n=1 Tax=Phytoactinopolyspora limicola TaxID=2715536 RepID=UPI00140A5CA4|nr:hypothetical protein [Phytoactinopolyspora limicola]